MAEPIRTADELAGERRLARLQAIADELATLPRDRAHRRRLRALRAEADLLAAEAEEVLAAAGDALVGEVWEDRAAIRAAVAARDESEEG